MRQPTPTLRSTTFIGHAMATAIGGHARWHCAIGPRLKVDEHEAAAQAPVRSRTSDHRLRFGEVAVRVAHEDRLTACRCHVARRPVKHNRSRHRRRLRAVALRPCRIGLHETEVQELDDVYRRGVRRRASPINRTVAQTITHVVVTAAITPRLAAVADVML